MNPPIPPKPISYLARCDCDEHDTVWTATAPLKGGVVYRIPCTKKQEPNKETTA